MIKRTITTATSLAVSALMAGAANATVVTGWNLFNVDVSSPTGAGESVIYDRDISGGTAGAKTNGKVIFDGDEGLSPGLRVDSIPFSAGGSSAAGCIRSNNPTTTCDGPFQSGKRFKNVITDSGPIDFVFDTDPDVDPGNTDPYRVFHRLINQSGSDIVDFAISLGTGVGDDFALSGADDGLSFSTSFLFRDPSEAGSPPSRVPATSQFPFGLFGESDENPNFDIDGFFASERTGFNLPDFSDSAGETDQISSDGIFGPYTDLFGPWTSLDQVPLGAFWDDDDDPDTDDLLIAWQTPNGLWEQRRALIDGVLSAIDPISDLAFEDIVFDDPLGTGAIEDLANLNLNYAIDVVDYAGTSFTLRVVANTVPAPAGAPLLLLGLAGLALHRRRARA